MLCSQLSARFYEHLDEVAAEVRQRRKVPFLNSYDGLVAKRRAAGQQKIGSIRSASEIRTHCCAISHRNIENPRLDVEASCTSIFAPGTGKKVDYCESAACSHERSQPPPSALIRLPLAASDQIRFVTDTRGGVPE